MLDVVARVEQQLTLSVEFNCLRWLVDTIGALKVFLGTLGQLSLRRVHNLVQIVNLTELALGVGTHDS